MLGIYAPSIVQTLDAYTAVFGSPAAVRTPTAGDSPIEALVHSATQQYLSTLRHAIAQHCCLAATDSAPFHQMLDIDLLQETWAQGGPLAGQDGVFRRGFGVEGLLAALAQLQADVAELWPPHEALDLPAMISPLAVGALWCAALPALFLAIPKYVSNLYDSLNL
jgi:hypothetical protein